MSIRYCYAFGALKICSSFEMHGLRPFRDPSDEDIVTVRFSVGNSPPPETGRLVFRWPRRYGISLWSLGGDWLLTTPGDGSFLVADGGRSVACFPDAGEISAGMGEILVRRILPRLVQLHGGIPLHAASLGDGGRTFLFFGPSGAGKSTLSAALNRDLGWELFGDDVSIVRNSDAGAPVAAPASMGISLWRDSLQGLRYAAVEPRRMAAHGSKFWCRVDDEKPLLSTPIAAFVLLAGAGTGPDPDRIEHAPVPARDAFFHLLSHLVRFDPTDTGSEARSFKALNRLATTIPTYALSYPRNYGNLRLVAERIAGLGRQTPGAR